VNECKCGNDCPLMYNDIADVKLPFCEVEVSFYD